MRAAVAHDAQIGWWGNFGGPPQKNIRTYCECSVPQSGMLTPAALSSFAQNPFAGVFEGYAFNGFRRVAIQLPYMGIPFAIGMRADCEEANNRLLRVLLGQQGERLRQLKGRAPCARWQRGVKLAGLTGATAPIPRLETTTRPTRLPIDLHRVFIVVGCVTLEPCAAAETARW